MNDENITNKAEALTSAELFKKAGIVTKTTGQTALSGLRAEGRIERIGKGVDHNPYRYFLA